MPYDFDRHLAAGVPAEAFADTFEMFTYPDSPVAHSAPDCRSPLPSSSPGASQANELPAAVATVEVSAAHAHARGVCQRCHRKPRAQLEYIDRTGHRLARAVQTVAALRDAPSMTLIGAARDLRFQLLESRLQYRDDAEKYGPLPHLAKAIGATCRDLEGAIDEATSGVTPAKTSSGSKPAAGPAAYPADGPFSAGDGAAWVAAAAAASREREAYSMLTGRAVDDFHRLRVHDRDAWASRGSRQAGELFATVVTALLDGHDWTNARTALRARASGSEVPEGHADEFAEALTTCWEAALADWWVQFRTGHPVLDDGIGDANPADLDPTGLAPVIAIVWLGHHETVTQLPSRSRSRLHEILAPATIRTDLEDGGFGAVVAPSGVAQLLVHGQLPGSYTVEAAGLWQPSDTVEVLRTLVRLKREDLSATDALTAARGVLHAG